jgi:hypothetical protein
MTKEVLVTIRLQFEASAANENNEFENFAVFTHLRMAEKNTNTVHGMTEFYSKQTGNLSSECRP